MPTRTPTSPPTSLPVSQPNAIRPILVVDCSAIAAILFDEPEGPATSTALNGQALVAPTLLPVELGHVCLKKMRRTPDAAPRLLAAYGARTLLGITLHEVDHDAVLRLAIGHGLSAYDACYLWLARHLDSPLLTLDTRLATAAQS